MAPKTINVVYEWDCETHVDDDIQHSHYDTFEEAWREHTSSDHPTTKVVLVRDDYRQLYDRSWAYIRFDGKVPTHFLDGCDVQQKHVPLRFHREVQRYFDKHPLTQ